MDVQRVCVFLVFLTGNGLAQGRDVVIPAGTELPVSIPEHLRMKVGEPIRSSLLYPVYVDNVLTLPAKTVVTGSVVQLTPDHGRRVKARLRFDFTPFRVPVVRFDGVVLPDGRSVGLVTGTARDGAPVYRLVAPPPRKGGFIARQFGVLKDAAKDRIRVVTGPDKRDRFVDLLYSQLPDHPQFIAKGTAWSTETTQSVQVEGETDAATQRAA